MLHSPFIYEIYIDKTSVRQSRCIIRNNNIISYNAGYLYYS